ncbi:MAG: SDR family oxidoreductase [Blastomonas sp.]|uniref:SDR family NAD(P)-dependent oxidoreductase n=1 Tax=Blastomonas sp. TaxID=1909299 RepID=UPI00258C1684|nr:SDR family oxidoreductase [Blastomonas sp.]MCO5794720.1 SDR family oxidoreductase [Blastomonas sp.]
MPQPTFFHGRLNGWRAIVTGAGTLGDGVGTGKAIAALFAGEGAKVALLDLDEARAQTTLDLIVGLNGEARVFTGNVAEAQAAERMTAEALEWLGGLDTLINNIGIGAGAGQLHTVPQADIDKVMAVNFGTVINMCRAAMPTLLEGQGKSIVNIASVAGILAHGNSAYGPSKAAVIQLTAELAVMYGRDGIRANCVAPGHIMTPMVEAYVKGEGRRVRSGIAPIGIEGDAWDIAQATLFLAGPESRFISGITLPVDGGVTVLGPLAAYERVSQEAPAA